MISFIPTLPTFPRPPPPLCTARVPTDATSAAADITQGVRAALLAGRRHLCVDVLTAAVDPRARTYDARAACTVLLSLISALQPVLTVEPPRIRVIVSGAAAALRVNEWLAEKGVRDVEVGLFGVEDEAEVAAYVVVDPVANGEGVVELRRLVREAMMGGVPVVVNNHPRRDGLYEMLGFGGDLFYEMTKFEPAFVLAPFALRAKGEGVGMRFVVMRKYPGKWALWRFLRGEGRLDMEGVERYGLCAEFDARPTDGELMRVISGVLDSTDSSGLST